MDYANRFAMFNGVYPDVKFRAFDLDKDQLEQNFKATTAFMFSIHDHLKHPEKLIDIARDHVSKYVILKGIRTVFVKTTQHSSILVFSKI